MTFDHFVILFIFLSLTAKMGVSINEYNHVFTYLFFSKWQKIYSVYLFNMNIIYGIQLILISKGT